MKKNWLFLLLLAVSYGVSAQQHKVVIQMTSGDTAVFRGLMNNLKHLKEGWGDSVQIEVVVHGPGIDFLTTAKTTQSEAISKMQSNGVSFLLCENTMKQKHVTKDQVLPGTGFVKMGIGEVILKQEQGWSYIKAGF